MTLRTAVLGVGRIGKMHAELLARQVPGASLAMVQDINANDAPGTCRASSSACILPIRPTPRTAVLSVTVEIGRAHV